MKIYKCDECGGEIAKPGLTAKFGWAPAYNYSVEITILKGNTDYEDLCLDCIKKLAFRKIKEAGLPKNRGRLIK